MPIPAAAILGGAVVGGAVNYISGQADREAQAEANRQNLAFAREKLEYEKGVQGKTWEREDQAVTRRVTDLQRAGLSPVLAAGSAAQTSAPINVTQPSVQAVGGRQQNMMQALQTAAMIAQIGQTEAGTEAAKAQARLTNSNAEYSELNTDLLMKKLGLEVENLGSDIETKKEQRESLKAGTSLQKSSAATNWTKQSMDAKDAQYYREYGFRKDDPNVPDRIKQAIQIYESGKSANGKKLIDEMTAKFKAAGKYLPPSY